MPERERQVYECLGPPERFGSGRNGGRELPAQAGFASAGRGPSHARRRAGGKMRKVVLQMMITLDGFVAGPNDEMDWIDNDPVMGEAHFALAEGADSAIVGHTVYQGMAQFWPQAAANPDAPNNEAAFGRLMNNIHKIVVSTKGEDLVWTNCEQLLVTDDKDLARQIAALKTQPGEYLLLYGGVRTAQTLIAHDLVDEYRLDVCPTSLGSGKALFPKRSRLRFVEATPYESGAMTVTYQSE